MSIFEEHLQDGTLSVYEKVDILFKRYNNKVTTDVLVPFQNENLDARPNILSRQVWIDDIPDTAPPDIFLLNEGDPDFLDDQGATLLGSKYGVTSLSEPVIRRYHKVPLIMVPGSNNLAYYLPISETPSGFTPSGIGPFQDLIPFNHDPNASFEIKLYKSNGDQIPFGEQGGHWSINHEYACITFFNYEQITDVDITNPPLISYYQYVGRKGLSNITLVDLGVSLGISGEIAGTGQGKEFNDGEDGCGDLSRAICIDTERGPLSDFVEGDCSYAIQFGPDSTCGNWRINVQSNGDGTTSLHFQYRTNTADEWKTKMHIDPAECDSGC